MKINEVIVEDAAPAVSPQIQQALANNAATSKAAPKTGAALSKQFWSQPAPAQQPAPNYSQQTAQPNYKVTQTPPAAVPQVKSTAQAAPKAAPAPQQAAPQAPAKPVAQQPAPAKQPAPAQQPAAKPVAQQPAQVRQQPQPQQQVKPVQQPAPQAAKPVAKQPAPVQQPAAKPLSNGVLSTMATGANELSTVAGNAAQGLGSKLAKGIDSITQAVKYAPYPSASTSFAVNVPTKQAAAEPAKPAPARSFYNPAYAANSVTVPADGANPERTYTRSGNTYVDQQGKPVSPEMAHSLSIMAQNKQ